MSGRDISLLLVGRTGNGKSSSGNSILGQSVFVPRGSTAAVTVDIKSASSVSDGGLINVVDGPGIGDLSMDSEKDAQTTIKYAKEALLMCKGGFSALLVTLKYGVRFTKQEKDAVAMIKLVFGKNVLSTHGVILFTFGDNFDLDTEDDTMTFADWCKEQTGDVLALFQECQYRCVLFNNKTKESERKRQQISDLMSAVNKIKTRAAPYTVREFEESGVERGTLVMRSKLPELEEKHRSFINSIYNAIDRINGNSYMDPKKAIQELQVLSDRVNQHKRFLEDEDKGSGLTKSMMVEVAVLETSIQTKIKRNQTFGNVTPTNFVNRVDCKDTDAPKQGTNKKLLLALLLIIFLFIMVYFLFSSQPGTHSIDHGSHQEPKAAEGVKGE